MLPEQTHKKDTAPNGRARKRLPLNFCSRMSDSYPFRNKTMNRLKRRERASPTHTGTVSCRNLPADTSAPFHRPHSRVCPFVHLSRPRSYPNHHLTVRHQFSPCSLSRCPDTSPLSLPYSYSSPFPFICLNSLQRLSISLRKQFLYVLSANPFVILA